MADLTNERIQQIWDYELISSWDEEGKNKMWMVFKNFICRLHPEREINYFDTPFSDVVDYLSSLNLKRCLDVNHVTGIYDTYAIKTDVIGFIHGRCEKLSMDLISGELKPIILMDINSYNWIKRDLNHNSKNASKKRRAALKDQANLKVRARELGGNHDWKVTK